MFTLAACLFACFVPAARSFDLLKCTNDCHEQYDVRTSPETASDFSQCITDCVQELQDARDEMLSNK
jgi:hypothetical protein